MSTLVTIEFIGVKIGKYLLSEKYLCKCRTSFCTRNIFVNSEQLLQYFNIFLYEID